MEGSSLGVRKGAWTEEEDILLKTCIQTYGEGKWHQVPSRAGLNRCRKSCRLRWLNYLKPNIKRGDFAADEVDLIIRLHKLLGNRWSLIAGRLPGRTANDVKNYWNTHLLKKFNPPNSNKDTKQRPHRNTSKPNVIYVIKPQPRALSKTSFRPVSSRLNIGNHNSNIAAVTSNNNLLIDDNNNCNENSSSRYYIPSDHNGDLTLWYWENLLMQETLDVDDHNQQQLCSFNNGFLSGLGDKALNEDQRGETRSKVVDEQDNYSCCLDDFFDDVDLWNVFDPQPGNCV